MVVDTGCAPIGVVPVRKAPAPPAANIPTPPPPTTTYSTLAADQSDVVAKVPEPVKV
jgi:hypothetical protein